MDWSDYSDVFFSCLNSHSDGSEDPLMRKLWNAKFLQIWWTNKLIYILDGNFGWSIPLKNITKNLQSANCVFLN